MNMVTTVREKLKTYIEECGWLARRGLFDGEGLYPGPGADSIPLLYAYKRGHLTGFTFRGWDAFSMARTLEQIGESPNEVFGRYLGRNSQNEFLEHWDHYTQAIGSMWDSQHLERALGDKRFDYIILKGTRAGAFFQSLQKYESFIRYLHDRHTKKGSLFLLSFSPGQNMMHDGEAADLLVNGLGYDNLTFTPPYFDREIANIRGSYPWPEQETVDIVGPPETADLGIPELKGTTCMNILITAGDLEFFRRRE